MRVTASAPLALPALVLALTASCGSADFAGHGGRLSSPAPAKSGGSSSAGGGGDASGKSSPGTGSGSSAATPPATTLAPGPTAGGTPTPQFPPIDASCASNASGGGIFGGFGLPVAPVQAVLAPTVPASCRKGVELNDFHGSFALAATPAGGAGGLTLEVDVATYEAPDRIRLLATDASGEHVILDSCRLKTSDYGDPTDGASRPPADSLRAFRPVLPPGTTSLRFDFTGSHTPQYLSVIGLCDFALTPAGGSPDLRPFGP